MGGLVPGPSAIPKFADVQVPGIKWHSIVGRPHPRMRNLRIPEGRLYSTFSLKSSLIKSVHLFLSGSCYYKED